MKIGFNCHLAGAVSGTEAGSIGACPRHAGLIAETYNSEERKN